MLYESEVIKFVCTFVESRGFRIIQRLKENEQGDDIIALSSGRAQRKLIIEAKGESSSRTGSSRFGKPFSQSQVRDHIAMAIYKSSEVLTRELKSDRCEVGVALPDNESHRRLLNNIVIGIDKLGLLVFWVGNSGSVDVYPKNWFARFDVSK